MLDDLVQGQLAHRRGDDVTAVAQDRRAVGDARDLVHAVRDVDDRDALGFEPAKEGEQFLDLAARERGRRLVEDEDADVARDRLDDFGQLALARRKIARLAPSDRCRRRASRRVRGRGAQRRRSSMKPSEAFISLLRKMFCATVSVGTRLISWKIMPMPARFAASGVCSVSGAP